MLDYTINTNLLVWVSAALGFSSWLFFILVSRLSARRKAQGIGSAAKKSLLLYLARVLLWLFIGAAALTLCSNHVGKGEFAIHHNYLTGGRSIQKENSGLHFDLVGQVYYFSLEPKVLCESGAKVSSFGVPIQGSLGCKRYRLNPERLAANNISSLRGFTMLNDGALENRDTVFQDIYAFQAQALTVCGAQPCKEAFLPPYILAEEISGADYGIVQKLKS